MAENRQLRSLRVSGGLPFPLRPRRPLTSFVPRHVAFAVEDIDAVVAGLRTRGAELVGELERYEDSYRLCYVRGPEGTRSSRSGQ